MRETHQRTIGEPVPLGDHSISVSLPTWKDTVSYKCGDPTTLEKMQTGYPRFFIPLVVRKLSKLLRQALSLPSEEIILLQSLRSAESCKDFITADGSSARVVSLPSLDDSPGSSLHAVLFPTSSTSAATRFWQHTGLGISSRLAERYLEVLHGSRIPSTNPVQHVQSHVTLIRQNTKINIRRRIGNLLIRDPGHRQTIHGEYSTNPGGINVEDSIFLYPTGMSAIWSAHQLLLKVFGARKSVCFGFPYTDTLKILRKWGPGCYFYPDGDEESMDQLEAMISAELNGCHSEPPILALFTEFPSNPLLRSVDLSRLRKLANDYKFLIVVDDTIGNFASVDVMPFADIVVSSLTKIFSGCANVMGGSLVLNPFGTHYAIMKQSLDCTWDDIYFHEDAAVMDLNSRDFVRRITIIDNNTEAVCDYLRSCDHVVSQVFYPKWQTRQHYDLCRVRTPSREAGFGGLFSLLFRSPATAHAFFDALTCAKGPSLGTNFTLACPYALLAHFEELDWAENYGVSRDIVRLSIGIEDIDSLLTMFSVAIQAAEQCCA